MDYETYNQPIDNCKSHLAKIQTGPPSNRLDVEKWQHPVRSPKAVPKACTPPAEGHVLKEKQ